MCDLFGVKDPVARHHAIDLGVAMQLTNICRDVYEDALNGRVYLPGDLFESITAEKIVSPDVSTTESVRQVVGYLLSEAEIRYESGISGSVSFQHKHDWRFTWLHLPTVKSVWSSQTVALIFGLVAPLPPKRKSA